MLRIFWNFVDGTVRPIARTSSNQIFGAQWKVEEMIPLSIVILELKKSSGGIEKLFIYGDSAYVLRAWLTSPLIYHFKGNAS